MRRHFAPYHKTRRLCFHLIVVGLNNSQQKLPVGLKKESSV